MTIEPQSFLAGKRGISFFIEPPRRFALRGLAGSSNHFSKKHATGFVPLPYQPENNDCGGGHPACRRAAVSRAR
jgi:hypothetical protein